MEKRILVIDDERRMAQSVRELLENHGYEVALAFSGNEGIEKLKESDFSVVITDLRMPEVDGYEVLKYLHESRPSTLAIVITGHASTESAIEALHYEAFDYLTKPFDFDLLRASVEKAFHKIETERLREDMISMLTHDIKIPLTSIIGYASLIYNAEGELNAKAREFIRTISSNGQKILTLIDNYLTSNKIAAGRLHLMETEIDLKCLVEDLLQIVCVDAEKRGVDLKCDIPESLPMVNGDESLLFRAFGNILNNAVKYTPEGGYVTMSLREVGADASPLKVPSVAIKVENTGPGIPAEDLSQIFERYTRSRNIHGIEGSGIGLYVVKNVIDAHAGKVVAESIPHQKTTFCLHLPVMRSS
ncbi:MAG: response regulator [bacterium]